MKLNEWTKEEWLDFCREHCLGVEWTAEQWDKKWEEFQAMKTKRGLQ